MLIGANWSHKRCVNFRVVFLVKFLSGVKQNFRSKSVAHAVCVTYAEVCDQIQLAPVIRIHNFYDNDKTLVGADVSFQKRFLSITVRYLCIDSTAMIIVTIYPKKLCNKCVKLIQNRLH